MRRQIVTGKQNYPHIMIELELKISFLQSMKIRGGLQGVRNQNHLLVCKKRKLRHIGKSLWKEVGIFMQLLSENTYEERKKKIEPSNAIPTSRISVPAPPKGPEHVVALAITLPVKQAFHSLYEEGIFMAPVWDSSKRQFVGMLGTVDFILILQEKKKKHFHLKDSESKDTVSSSSRRSCPKWESYAMFQKYDEEMAILDRINAQKLHETVF